MWILSFVFWHACCAAGVWMYNLCRYFFRPLVRWRTWANMIQLSYITLTSWLTLHPITKPYLILLGKEYILGVRIQFGQFLFSKNGRLKPRIRLKRIRHNGHLLAKIQNISCKLTVCQALRSMYITWNLEKLPTTSMGAADFAKQYPGHKHEKPAEKVLGLTTELYRNVACILITVVPVWKTENHFYSNFNGEIFDLWSWGSWLKN